MCCGVDFVVVCEFSAHDPFQPVILSMTDEHP